MTATSVIDRRRFLAAAAAGAGTLMAPSVRAESFLSTPAPADYFHGLKVGMASYTVRKFSRREALEMTERLGLKYIKFKQDFHLPLDTPLDEVSRAAELIRQRGMTLTGCGVVYMGNDETKIKNLFEYAKAAGMEVITAAPDEDALPAFSRMAKAYDIKVAIHNHGPNDKRYPSALDAYKLAKQLDERIGCCVDIGHTVRIGENVAEILEQVQDRLYDLDLKDETQPTAKGSPLEVGRGCIDIPGVLKTLKKINYQGLVALEYEKDADAPFPGMSESIGYIRGVLDGMA
ncbi:MAG: TIM barrel protein [bacterium]|nr:TIM barrel protein [bacterium]